jgi:hypothetical protein
MWQNRFDSRLELEPRASRYLLIYLVLVHGLALLALVPPLHLPGWGLLLLAVMVLASLLYWLGRLYRARHTITKLIWRRDGMWDYRAARHQFDYARLLPGSYITRFLIVLQLQPLRGRAVRIVLLPDMLPGTQWHQLWLRLKYADFADR